MIDKNVANKLWEDVFGKLEWAQDCFGTWVHKDAWSNEEVKMLRPGNDKKYDYSWNVDHIRPKSDFKNETDSDFYNNYEPMHRLNNEKKSDNYPEFSIEKKNYKVFKHDAFYGYGILDLATNTKIDWKSKQNKSYK
ncbi:MAG: hypothetical protein KKH92_04840 [Firmicutes bacterium]|nr:hypothetical protein [Bacillota bacterium]